MDGNITHDFWKTNNDKWHTEKDMLFIKLQEIIKLDKQFYEQSDILLRFTEDAYQLYLQGTLEQRRKIIEIISLNLSYKNKEFSINLKPIFQTIVENTYKIHQENANNRTLENGNTKGVEPNSTPKYIKNSPGKTRTYNPAVNSRMLCH